MEPKHNDFSSVCSAPCRGSSFEDFLPWLATAQSGKQDKLLCDAFNVFCIIIFISLLSLFVVVLGFEAIPAKLLNEITFI